MKKIKSYRDLAKAVGITPANIVHKINGTQNAAFKLASKIAVELDSMDIIVWMDSRRSGERRGIVEAVIKANMTKEEYTRREIYNGNRWNK